jgi:hypothetical protein
MSLPYRIATGPTFTKNTNTSKNTGTVSITPNTTISLYDGDEHITLTPKILKRLIEMVKKEYPEDFL